MQIMCTVSLTKDDKWDMTVDETAAKVLLACGGDPKVDICMLTIQPPMGQAGTPPPPLPVTPPVPIPSWTPPVQAVDSESAETETDKVS